LPLGYASWPLSSFISPRRDLFGWRRTSLHRKFQRYVPTE
jgi:hypothetical protein